MRTPDFYGSLARPRVCPTWPQLLWQEASRLLSSQAAAARVALLPKAPVHQILGTTAPCPPHKGFKLEKESYIITLTYACCVPLWSMSCMLSSSLRCSRFSIVRVSKKSSLKTENAIACPGPQVTLPKADIDTAGYCQSQNLLLCFCVFQC